MCTTWTAACRFSRSCYSRCLSACFQAAFARSAPLSAASAEDDLADSLVGRSLPISEGPRSKVHTIELVLICHRARSHLVLMKVSEDRTDAFVALAGLLTEVSATFEFFRSKGIPAGAARKHAEYAYICRSTRSGQATNSVHARQHFGSRQTQKSNSGDYIHLTSRTI